MGEIGILFYSMNEDLLNIDGTFAWNDSNNMSQGLVISLFAFRIFNSYSISTSLLLIYYEISSFS